MFIVTAGREMPRKTTTRHHCTPIGMAKANVVRARMQKRGSLIHWPWEFKVAQPPWKRL